jgi:hypothetical protein
VSLQGTLETIPLSDVLSLLSVTGKSGELRVTGGRGDGRLWLDGGKVVGSDVPGAATPADAVFELLRLSSGSFAFDADVTAPEPGDPHTVDALLREATERLAVWKAIEAVVPSTACRVGLAAELASDSVTVSRHQWHDLVAVASAGDVQGVMQRLGLGEFDASRTVKELVDAGLVRVAPAPVRREPAAPPRRIDAPPAPPAPPAPAARTERPAAPSSTPSAPAASAPAPAPTRPSSPAARPAASPAPAKAAPPRRAAATQASDAAPARPGPAALPSREEAEELVHQLAALSQAPVSPKASARSAEDTGEEGTDQNPTATVDSNGRAARQPGSPTEEEPINRGMLLKFLSSVRP